MKDYYSELLVETWKMEATRLRKIALFLLVVDAVLSIILFFCQLHHV